MLGRGVCESESFRDGWGDDLRVVDAFRRSSRAGLYFDVVDGSGDGERLRCRVAPGDSARWVVNVDPEDLRKERGAIVEVD